MQDLLTSYLPVIIFFGIALFIAIALAIAPFIVAYRAPDSEKLSAYECGFNAFDDARMKFIHTSNSDNECDFRGSWDMDLSISLGTSSSFNLTLLRFSIITFILLDSLQECLSLGFILSSSFLSLLFEKTLELKFLCLRKIFNCKFYVFMFATL